MREKNNKNKRLRWAHNLEMKKKIQKKEENEKLSTQNDKKKTNINKRLRYKKRHLESKKLQKQKTKVSTQSWDLKKIQNKEEKKTKRWARKIMKKRLTQTKD